MRLRWGGQAALTTKAGVSIAAEQQEHQRIRVLVVPRHPQCFAEVQALAKSAGLTVRAAPLGRQAQRKGDPSMQADVWLGDTLREVALYYTMSEVALLGASFASLGGQKLIDLS